MFWAKNGPHEQIGTRLITGATGLVGSALAKQREQPCARCAPAVRAHLDVSIRIVKATCAMPASRAMADTARFPCGSDYRLWARDPSKNLCRQCG